MPSPASGSGAAEASWVAGAFESSSRLEDLSFGHHDAVCGNPKAGELLEWAASMVAAAFDERSLRRDLLEWRLRSLKVVYVDNI